MLIGSSGERGSFKSLESACELVKLYIPSGTEIETHRDPIDFEDIENLQQAYEYWIDSFRKRGIPEREVILDATGGQKTTSIAAALTTLRWRRIRFQYVQTEAKEGDEHKVLGFNVVAGSPEQPSA